MAIIKPDSTVGGSSILTQSEVGSINASNLSRANISSDSLKILTLSSSSDNFNIYEINYTNGLSSHAFNNTPYYSISVSSSNIDEGSDLTVTVTTVNVVNGTTLYWDTDRSSDFTTSSGDFIISGITGSFTITPTEDAITEGTETFTVRIRTGSPNGTIVATSNSININDTSLTPSGSQLFTVHTDINPNYQSFVVPTGVTSINIFAVGAGGGGSHGRYSAGSGAGGGGGGYVEVSDLAVTPGATFYFLIGSPGVGGSLTTSSPYKTVNGPSSHYPQSGTETGAVSGGNTVISYNGDPAYVSQSTYIIVAGSGQGAGLSSAGAQGGSATLGSSTYVTDNASSYTTLNGTSGVSSSTSTTPGEGGGAGYGGNGGYGIGNFHRSNGGWDYYKAARGGLGGGMRLLGGTTLGNNGANAPAMGFTSPYNYTGAGDGYDGGDSAFGVDGYGGGGGGGTGGQIRNQNIISSSGYSYQHRWYLGHSGLDGEQGGLRFSW